MWFEGKRASAITGEEIAQLVHDAVPEDGSLEYKQQLHKNDADGTQEMLRDIAALANASGGYLVIGIQEKDGRASKIIPVADADRQVVRVRDLCLEYIKPAIRDMEAVPLLVDGKTIIVVHVRESSKRPHMVTYQGQTYFCRRHGDCKRIMSIEEILDAFREQVLSFQLGGDKLISLMGELLTHFRAGEMAKLESGSSAQEAKSSEQVRRIMDLRFREAVGSTPYFRIICSPIDSAFVDVASHAEEIRQLLARPPKTRDSGWTIWAPSDLRRTTEGWFGDGPGDRQLILLANGYLQYSKTCNDESFQWGRLSSHSPTPELYPFAVCELPINFTRLAQAIFDIVKPTGSLEFSAEYVNIKGFLLRPSVPGSRIYGAPALFMDAPIFDGDRVMTNTYKVEPGFDPDPLAFDLVKDVYSAFGLPSRCIPFFDSRHRFDPESNSPE